jgi:transposase, IS5 family
MRRSRERVRGIERVVAHDKGPMGLVINTIGLVRAKWKIGLANLACNIRRFAFLHRRAAAA